MFTVIGREETPYRPIPGRIHPKEGSFLHRRGRAVKDADGRIIGRVGECVRKQRHSVCGLRDKMATASSSAKTSRFVNANASADRRLDGEDAPRPVLTHTPVPDRGLRLRRRRSSHRPLAATLNA